MSHFVRCVGRALGALLLTAIGFNLAIPGAAFSADRRASIVVDLQSGKVLQAENADELRYPASLTKIMTLYLLFEDLEAGIVRLDDQAKVSADAARQPPSKLGLKPGSTISLSDALKALVTKSANDMAVVVAEHLAGSEEAFAERMTAKARALGMSKTTFKNASGLPNSEQMTTARDMALLGTAIQQHFPERYKYFSIKSFKYGKRRFKNHNRLLGRLAGVDGIKTGYTRASGFNLALSYQRKGRHLVAVVMGQTSSRKREARMRSLINASLPRASSRPVNPIAVAKVPRDVGAMVAAAEKAKQAKTAQVAGEVKPAAVERNPKAAAAAAGLAGDMDESVATLPSSASALAGPLPPAVRRKAQVAAAAQMIPAPAMRPDDSSIASEVEARVAAATPDADESEPARKALAAARGWAVQVGVTPTARGAESLLEKARGKAKTLLAVAAPMTEKITKDDKVLYRARFAGLDRAAAKEVCEVLKKNDLACFTTRN